ncbi:MAG: tetratricopeptide repeat protein, partial [Gemmataceae bacterium]|nr:tetratricopeptide repeat protein [Gemmataceae bacterium]
LLHVQLRQYAFAMADFNRVRALDPKRLPWQEVVRVYAQAIEQHPKDAEAYHQRAHAHERLGQREEALDDYSLAIELAPRNPSLHVSRGQAYLRLGEKDKAAEDFRKAVELKPKEANNLAWELVTAPDPLHRAPSVAVKLAKQAVRQVPAEALYWNTLGVAHYRTEAWEAAIQALEEAEKRAPGKYFSFNAFFLAMCHHQLGATAKARDAYERAVRWCQENQGKLSAAHQEELKAFRAEAAALMKMPSPGP